MINSEMKPFLKKLNSILIKCLDIYNKMIIIINVSVLDDC